MCKEGFIRARVINHVNKLILVLLGSVITAVGLQYFLLPNHLLDGGVVGISIIAAHVTHLPLGLFLVLLNLPFLYLGYRKLGRHFAMYSTFGIALLALLTTVFHVDHGLTMEPILAAVFGGILVGIGVGLVIRFGGTLDGTDTVAILVERVSTFSIGEVVMAINAIIFTISAFVLGWDSAMYSVIAYFVAHKAIDVTVDGLNESRSMWIVSRHYGVIGKGIEQTTGRKITYFKDSDEKKGVPRGIILAVITRFEEQRIKAIVQRVDPNAFIVITKAHEIIGKNFTK